MDSTSIVQVSFHKRLVSARLLSLVFWMDIHTYSVPAGWRTLVGAPIEQILIVSVLKVSNMALLRVIGSLLDRCMMIYQNPKRK